MRKSFKRIIEFLNNLTQEKIIKDYALIGGLAVSSWVIPRATKDIDFLIELSKELTMKNIGELIDRIKMEFPQTELLRDSLIGMYVIRIEDGETLIDLIIGSKKWHMEILKDSARIDSSLFGARINIARPEGLIVMKLKAGGHQDLVDAKNLLGLEIIDREKLFHLAKSARVDKKLIKILKNRICKDLT